MLSEIKTYLGADWEEFQKVFRKNLEAPIDLIVKINEYLLSRSGKQLRPVLCLLTAKACGGACSSQTIECAAAVEMLHTATLLHDDVADDAALRRGNPTIRSLYSPQSAVLIGDFWLSKAIHAIIDSCGKDIFSSFATCLENLAYGEILQMEKAEKMDTSMEDYLQIIDYKTASLFRTAVYSGASTSKADKTTIEAMNSYACHLGLAFQMRDDILDYHPASQTGKPAGGDILERKITLPLIEAFRVSSDREVRNVKRMISNGKVEQVIAFVMERNGLALAQDILTQESHKAVEALDGLAPSPALDYLKNLALHLCSRKH